MFISISIIIDKCSHVNFIGEGQEYTEWAGSAHVSIVIYMLLCCEGHEHFESINLLKEGIVNSFEKFIHGPK